MNIDNQIISRRRRAFLWILAIFIVFAIATILLTCSSFLLVQRENARRERCEHNLKIMCEAAVEYANANGVFPPAFTVDGDGKRLHSWRTLLLPYLGEDELYSQIRLDEPWDSEWNRQFWTKTPNVYRCASTPVDENESIEAKAKRCAYSCVLGPNTVFPSDGRSVAPREIVDGNSNTIMFVERKEPGNWMDPNGDLTFDQVLNENVLPVKERKAFGSWHGRGECVALCDGSLSFLSENIDNSVLTLLLGIDDSKDLPEEQNELSAINAEELEKAFEEKEQDEKTEETSNVKEL